MPSNRHTPCPPRCTFVQDSTWHRMGTSSFNNDPGRTTGRTTGRLAIPSEKHHTSTAKVPRRFHRSENLSTFLATYSHNFTKKVQLLKKEGSSNVKSGPGTRPNRCRGGPPQGQQLWSLALCWWMVDLGRNDSTSGHFRSFCKSSNVNRDWATNSVSYWSPISVYCVFPLRLWRSLEHIGVPSVWSRDRVHSPSQLSSSKAFISSSTTAP